jgi:hypothetical protein
MSFKDSRKQLAIGNEKYIISNSFYTYLLSGTNKIGDYNKAKTFVKTEITKALKGEVERVSSFTRNKIDFEV